MVLTRSWDEIAQFFRRPKLEIAIGKRDAQHNLAWIVKNKKGKGVLQNLRLVIRSPKIVSGGVQLLRGFNLDGEEEIVLRLDLDKERKLAIEPQVQPEIDRIDADYVKWGGYPIAFNDAYDFELKFSASNIRHSDAKPKRYRFIAKSFDDLQLSEIKPTKFDALLRKLHLRGDS